MKKRRRTTPKTKRAHRSDRSRLWIGVGIFCAALVVRFIYLYEFSKCPRFLKPIVDANLYDDLARRLVNGETAVFEFFVQAFFYPLWFLRTVYLLSGSSILFAKVVQAVLGAVVCALVYQLGCKVFDRRTGVLAGVITALYGPLIFFDTELLATGWASFWSVTLMLLLLKASEKTRLWIYFVLGLCGGLSTITRPTFFPFFAVAGLWVLYMLRRASIRWAMIAGRAGLILTGFILIAGSAGIQCHRATGHFSFLPSSGALSMYLGNNPQRTETLTARPGPQWANIVEMPVREGWAKDDVWEDKRFFMHKFRSYVRDDPLDYIAGLVHKTVQFVSSREIPRNVDMYLSRNYSSLFSVLTFKVGKFGFPFLILLPFTLLGLIFRWRQIPLPFYLFLIFYPLSIILVFVSARYRTPIVPIMAVSAAAGFWSLFEAIKSRQSRTVVLMTLIGTTIAVVPSIAGPFAEEKINFEAEMYWHMSKSFVKKGRLDEAVEYLNKSLEIDPYLDVPYNNLGIAFSKQNRYKEAVEYYSKALEIDPEDHMAHSNMGNSLLMMGKVDQAVKSFSTALQIAPDIPDAHRGLGNAFLVQKKYDLAIEQFNQLIEIEPNSPDAYSNLGYVMAVQGKYDKAIDYFTQAIRLKPDFADAYRNLRQAFAKRDRISDTAAGFAAQVHLNPNSAQAQHNLAVALLNENKPTEAVKHFRQVLRIEPNRLDSMNNLAWLLATHREAKYYDPKEAIRLAKRACQLTDYRNPGFLDTLAAAYAASGSFSEAVAMAEKALGLARTPELNKLAEQIQKHIILYKSGKPLVVTPKVSSD